MKRVISFLMAFTLCLSMLPAAALAAKEPEPRSTLTADATPPEIPTEGDVWDGVTITQPSKIVKKDGVNYYEISTCAELAYVAQTGGDWLSRNYLLANNLILNDVVLEWDEEGNLLNDPTTLHEWTPIGGNDDFFAGMFNGGKHVISGLFVNKEGFLAGLFGSCKGSISSVTVVNAFVLGYDDVGIICGMCSEGSITDCVSYGSVRASGYGNAGGICGYSGNISNCVNYGVVLGRDWHTGGICGKITDSRCCSNCTNFSTVFGEKYVGGICGGGEYQRINIDDCINYGKVSGNSYIGGICGIDIELYISSCINYGAVSGNDEYIGGIGGLSFRAVDCLNNGEVTSNGESVGGICGSGAAINCVNTAKVLGESNVGGICGTSTTFAGYDYDNICQCANYGEITGNKSVGGVCGNSSKHISNCYNAAAISGNSNIGGIVGSVDNGFVNCSYNIGGLKYLEANNIGAIVGSDGAVWDKDTITGCYYLKTDTVNSDLYGCGGVTSADMEPEGFYARNEAAMKQQSTYEGWNFDSIWRISPDRNGGYPYLAIEDELPGGGSDAPITVQALTIHEASLSLGVGDTVYLTATPSPMNADISALTWSSSDDSVAQVAQNGRLTAVAPGSATITASCGGVSASCTVTVTPRASDEYALGTLVVRDESGTELSAIPRGNSLVTIPITKQSDGGSALVLLAAYGADGQYQGLMYVQVKNVPLGATVEITLPLDNADGKIARLKAFPVASFSDPTPLGAASEFPQS